MLPKTVFSRGKFVSSYFTSIGCFRRLFLVMGSLYHRILSATGSKAEGLFSHARRKRVGGLRKPCVMRLHSSLAKGFQIVNTRQQVVALLSCISKIDDHIGLQGFS